MALLFSMILKKYHPPPPPNPKKKKRKKKTFQNGWFAWDREKMPIPGAHNLGGGGGVVY